MRTAGEKVAFVVPAVATVLIVVSRVQGDVREQVDRQPIEPCRWPHRCDGRYLSPGGNHCVCECYSREMERAGLQQQLGAVLELQFWRNAC